MSDEKMMEAAVSAVMNYIKEEELEQQKNAEEKELWGISGRQTQMHTRDQMQRKSFYGWKQRQDAVRILYYHKQTEHLPYFTMWQVPFISQLVNVMNSYVNNREN